MAVSARRNGIWAAAAAICMVALFVQAGAQGVIMNAPESSVGGVYAPQWAPVASPEYAPEMSPPGSPEYAPAMAPMTPSEGPSNAAPEVPPAGAYS